MRKTIRRGAPSAPVFTFEAKVWLYPGDEAWHFVSLPKELSDELDVLFADLKRGFGSLKVRVTLAEISWETSIFPSKERGTYMLPLKAAVRKKTGLSVGDTRHFILEILI